MSDFEFISGDPDNLTGGSAANMVDIQGPFVDLREWLNTDLQPRVATAIPTLVTSLPVSAVDGQEIYYLVDPSAGIIWHLRYRAASPNAQKWEKIGGQIYGLQQTVSSSQSTANVNTFADMTGGPTMTVPLTGLYYVTFYGSVQQSSVGLGDARIAVSNQANVLLGNASGQIVSSQFEFTNPFRRDGISATAGDTLKLRVSTNNLAHAFGNVAPWRLDIDPIRVG